MARASSTGLCDAAVPRRLRHHHPDDHDECRDADHRREFRLSATRAPATSASASGIGAGSPSLGLPICMPSALRTLCIGPAASGGIAIPTPMSRISETEIQSRAQ